MEQNQIILISGKDCWLAKYVGPHAQKIIRLFGTDTLPTPFIPGLLLSEDTDRLRAAIEKMNPDVFVSFA
jgi:hypothetical protein